MFDLCIGDQIVDVLSGAKKEVVVVAPFIKVNALKRIVDCINSDKVKIDCVTRWLPQDIAAGVCDIEIYELLRRLPNANLWMNKRLHAKYVRADKKCLTGSANLTESALGWRVPSNLELMVDVSSEFQDMKDWEVQLFDCSIAVTKKVRDRLKNSADSLIENGTEMRYAEFHVDDSSNEYWLPQYSVPEKLYGIYSGKITTANISKSSFRYAMIDLTSLGIPAGLSEKEFNVAVAKQICNSKIIMEILNLSKMSKAAGVSMNEVEQIIMTFNEQVEVDDNENSAKRIVEWVVQFLAEYRTESEVVRLIRAIEI